MPMDPKISSFLMDLGRRYGFEFTLAVAIAAAVRIVASRFFTGPAATAAAFALSLLVIVPIVCLIALWAALGEETTLSRAGQAAIRLLGLYFCLALPASFSYQAAQEKLDVVFAHGLAANFLGALIPAWLLRLMGWRLHRSVQGAVLSASRRAQSKQFGLLTLFRVITTLCVLLALGIATQRAYNTFPEDFLYFGHLPEGLSESIIAATITGIAAISLFCLWFRDHGRGRAWMVFIHFAAWMSINALCIAVGSALQLAPEPSLPWLVLAIWSILFLPMSIASHVAQSRGWRLARKS